MSFGLETFQESPLGQGVGRILGDHDTIVAMITLSEHGIPAVQAIGRRIMNLGLPITDNDKKSIGRWVRERMEANGWTITGRSGRVAEGNLFSTGAIYQPLRR